MNQLLKSCAFLGTLCALGWGILFPLTRAIVVVYPPLTTVSLRFLIIAFAVLPFLKKNNGQTLKLFWISLLMMSVPFGGLAIGMVYMESGVVSLFLQLEPLILILAGAILFKEKMHLRHLVGFLIAITGVYFVVRSPEINMNHPVGLAGVLISVFSYCWGAVLLRSINLSSKQIMMWSTVLALPQILLIAGLLEGNLLHTYASMEWWVYVLSIIIGAVSIFINGLYSYLLKKYTFGQVTPYMMLVPIFSIIFGFFMLGETIELQALFGGGLIIAGVALATVVVAAGKGKNEHTNSSNGSG